MKPMTTDAIMKQIYVEAAFRALFGFLSFKCPLSKMCHKRIGYNLNVMRQSACLVIDSTTVDKFAALFNCTPVDRASDSMMVSTYS